MLRFFQLILAIVGPSVVCYYLWGGWAALLCCGLQCFWLLFTPSDWSS